jgi:hypothetical protein
VKGASDHQQTSRKPVKRAKTQKKSQPESQSLPESSRARRKKIRTLGMKAPIECTIEKLWVEGRDARSSRLTAAAGMTILRAIVRERLLLRLRGRERPFVRGRGKRGRE